MWMLDFGLKRQARELARAYGDTYMTLNRKMASHGSATVEQDPQTVQQLRALGYID